MKDTLTESIQQIIFNDKLKVGLPQFPKSIKKQNSEIIIDKIRKIIKHSPVDTRSTDTIIEDRFDIRIFKNYYIEVIKYNPGLSLRYPTDIVFLLLTRP